VDRGQGGAILRGVPLRSRLIANFSAAMAVASRVPAVYNFLVRHPFSWMAIKQRVMSATSMSESRFKIREQTGLY
jgi:hypothetical protein